MDNWDKILFTVLAWGAIYLLYQISERLNAIGRKVDAIEHTINHRHLDSN